MASPNIWRSGFGGTTGATLATISPVYASGDVWYVSSASGSDAVSPRGKERIRPLATLAQAYTNATNNDTIVMLSGHEETLTAVQNVSKTGLSIIGEGSGSTRPRITRNANAVVLNISGAGCLVDNIYFPTSVTTASASTRIALSAAGITIRNCYFQSGTLDDGSCVDLATSADYCTVEGCTFISTASSPSDQPGSCITVTNAVSGIHIGGPLDEQAVVFDGGDSGWANPYALNGTGAVTRLDIMNLDLLNDSDILLATGTVGRIHIRNTSGSGRLVWTA